MGLKSSCQSLRDGQSNQTMKRPYPLNLVRSGAFAARILATSSAVLLASHPAQAQNTVDQYTGSGTGSLVVVGNWNLGSVPLVHHDAVFAATSGIRKLTASDLTVGSFNVTAATGTYSIRNETSTSTHSHLMLGGTGNLGNSVSGTPADLLYVAAGSTFNIIGANGSSPIPGTGVLRLILGQSGHFNIAGTSAISAAITDGGNGHGITKTGGGTLTLAGVNDYRGDTSVSGGSLVLAAAAGLKFVVTDTVSNRLTGTGTVTLDGDFTVDTAAVTRSSGSWSLVAVATRSFGDNFHVAGFSPQGDGITWTRTDGTRLWTFSEASGALVLTAAGTAAYDLWAAAAPYHLTGIQAGFDFDYDQDGIDNGLEWILGGNPTANDAPAILPAVTGSAATGLTLVFNRAVDSVAECTLAVEWDSDPGAFSNIIAIGGADVPANGNHPVVDLDAPAAGRVTVSIPAANASGGKLFARLKASRN